ncbi:uncharacterized protein LAESUDRAFT_715033 [Laetiporus sulphureus 93-53]|uniref:Uncharacterized protein n=1 Tax=Laetiporus sulphureus 93-53 TaxID=1314785 RepID=A0A165DMW8_9APHY|nr:uncharacterized protein LAESUDRAFT_715033 [Laetiporus sulphureus 93-53]KZT05232.1 hypothetical protein LAESUDRAFT_715033 [Laetiporus sulphureus 93-53]
MSATKLSQELHSIAATWHVDPFRPNLQLKNFLDSLADHPNLTARAVRAASALQKNEFQKRYQLSEKMLKPASMPHHYDRLVEGYEKSAKGVGRPWWKIFFGVW